MHHLMKLSIIVGCEAIQLWNVDKKAYWRLIKKHGRSPDNERLFLILALKLKPEQKDSIQHVFRLALYTDLSYLLHIVKHNTLSDIFIPKDKKLARFLRRKLKSGQCINRLSRIKKPEQPFKFNLWTHRALFKALIKHGHRDFVFKELEPYSDYIKG